MPPFRNGISSAASLLFRALSPRKRSPSRMKTLTLLPDYYIFPMSDANAPNHSSCDEFVDAIDDFLMSDLGDVPETDESAAISEISCFNSVENGETDLMSPTHSSESSVSCTLRRRSSIRTGRRKIPIVNANESSVDDSSGVSEIIQVSETNTPRERRNKILFALKDPDKLGVDDSPGVSEIVETSEAITPRERRNKILSALKDQDKEWSDSPRFKPSLDQNSSKYDQNHFQIEKLAAADSPVEEVEESSSSFLVPVAGFIIKVIGFQISLLVSFFSFPFWLMHLSFMLVTDPFGIVKRAKDGLYEKLYEICGLCFARVSPWIGKHLCGSQSIGKFALKLGWGFFWSFYVSVVLFGLLLTAFLIGGITLRYFVEKPIRIEENLNFDYTKATPVAFVPVISCSGVDCGLDCGEMNKVVKHVGGRVIPQNHKLQVTISMVLPESDYNRKLGVFQIHHEKKAHMETCVSKFVAKILLAIFYARKPAPNFIFEVRVDFLSPYGRIISTSRLPCMLRFKSSSVRLLETFVKSGALITGYSSESQQLKLRMTGLAEGTEPTSCLRVMLEQRAEFKPGSGIPEIYAASLVLESELPFLKRIIWNWKKTIFIWISMGFFTTELLFVLICCRPFVIPRARPRARSEPRLRDGSVIRTKFPKLEQEPAQGGH